jgi:hemin uptake protein HemP
MTPPAKPTRRDPAAVDDASPGPANAASRAKRVTSDELFRGAREVTILHDNEHYRLRITRLGKLILTK